MPKPVLHSEGIIAGNSVNHDECCRFIIPGDNLSINISSANVIVNKTNGTPVKVLSARARQLKSGSWVLIVKTERVPRHTGISRLDGDDDEIEVTVTNPDDDPPTDPSDPPDPPIEVVYYDEENPPPDPPPDPPPFSGLSDTASTEKSGGKPKRKSKKKPPTE